MQQHRLCQIIDSTAKDNQELLSLLEDSEGTLAAELEKMQKGDVFGSFYTSIAATREYYARFPYMNTESGPIPSALQSEPEVPFSGEEVFGKYLDLHRFHLEYINLPHIQTTEQDYIQYLDKFNSFFYISENCKTTKHYRSYITGLWEYLSDFFSRIQPLVEKESTIASWKPDFEEKWSSGKFPGWKKRAGSSNAPQPVRLGMFNSIEELEALGLDRLKEGLEALELKCGGTLRDRAERLWSVRGKKPEDFPQKIRAPRNKQAGEDSSDHKEVIWFKC